MQERYTKDWLSWEGQFATRGGGHFAHGNPVHWGKVGSEEEGGLWEALRGVGGASKGHMARKPSRFLVTWAI